MSKFLLISHIFPPAVDGGSKVVWKLGQFFQQNNHQTLYLSSDCSSTDDFTKSKYQKSKIPKNYQSNVLKLPVYHHLRRPLKFINLFLPKKSYLYGLLKVSQKGPIFKIIPFIKITSKIIKFKPDYIIAGPLPTTTILYARFFKFLTNLINHQSTKLLINASFHQTDPDFHALPLIKTLQKTDFIWTLTQYETDYFVQKYKINPQKIILAGNGVDSNFIISKIKEKSNQKPNILFIGNLCSHKRVDLLIKSFSQIKSNASLIIVGQKTLFYPEIQKIYQSLNSKIKKHMEFKFNVFDKKELINLIDNSLFLVLPSIQESFGLVLIESWARGKAVLTTDIPPLQELVQKSHGGLNFKIDDQEDLQKQIQKLINNSKLRTEFGQNGLNYVKNHYTWDLVGQKIWQKISP
ncbi:MAG: glycosyltransferase family 4 protein [Candidatus Shapirobacteria bacterium]|nr:glycosyltransferase family 4 protein [Candidatus Shapirobacteria bacterium]